MGFKATAAAIVVAALAVSIAVVRAEVLVVTSTNIVGVYTSPLNAGVTYEIIAEGTYCWDSNCFRADAEWYDQNNGTWVEHPPGDPARETFELHIDNAPVAWEGNVDGVNWVRHALSPTHRYRTLLVGTGAPVKLHIADTYPYEHIGGYDWTGDNSGGLTVTISALDPPSDGSLVAWGENSYGECTVPPPNVRFVAVAAGGYHSLGLTIDGTIIGWGYNNDGRCVPPQPNSGFEAISAGASHSMALRSSGAVEAWGTNTWGQCNVPTSEGPFIAIAAGGGFSLALTPSGSIAAWGRGDMHQRDVPSPNTGFVSIAAGYAHSLALRTDGTVTAWGDNAAGQCDVPMLPGAAVAVAAGGFFSLALLADGSIVGWGSNDDGQCVPPSPNAGFTAIAAGDYHAAGVKVDGSIVAWGQHLAGKCDVPEPNIGFVAVDAGAQHSLGLHQLHLGACCLHAFCTLLSEEDCHGYGGSYEGNGTVCTDSTCATSGVELPGAGREFRVTASPNPFSELTRISFWLARSGWTSVRIYDAAGRLVQTLAMGEMVAGPHTVTWDGSAESGVAAPPGIYFSRVQTGAGVMSGRVVRR